MGWLRNDPDREARARMEAAARASERKYSDKPNRPQRYKLYDRIADRVSLNVMNIIIGVTALLLIVALIVGIATGSPR